MKSREKKLWVLFSLAMLIGAIIFLSLILLQLKKDTFTELSKDFQSLIKPVITSEMNVVLFTIDTLRADHLACYGYEGVKTPHIDRFANEGILFQYAIAQAPLTLPSHSSLLTGTYPLWHGVRDNAGFYLDEIQSTLAEVLKNEGYSTAAFVAAFVLDSRWGLNQGFDYYYDNFDLTKYRTISLDAVQRSGDKVLAEAYRWIEQNYEKKFFVWIHLYDPHTPYDPPEPYRSQYAGKRFGLYDGEIAYVDQLIGEFRNFQESKNYMDNTVIILTSDHGESLGEHKESAHGFFIYDATVRIPLIIRLPGGKLSDVIVDKQVRSIDVMPTILHLVNATPPKTVQGKSLLSLILGGEEGEPRDAYSETYWPKFHFGWSEIKFLRRGQYKFIDAPRPELYDIHKDPGELNNIVNSNATLAEEMKRELDDMIKQNSASRIDEARPKKLDDDSLVKFQALGYIGSFHTSSTKIDEMRANPKDRIEFFNEIKIAQFLVTEGKTNQAIEKIMNVLSKDSSILEARYILGNIYAIPPAARFPATEVAWLRSAQSVGVST